mmetsp:Transcript_13298/g.53350  ORF Transcript_13298/g.53350 Transcript_13298/m.53350 type:complete len:317 (+) Transcript_13298:514-1464(+)
MHHVHHDVAPGAGPALRDRIVHHGLVPAARDVARHRHVTLHGGQRRQLRRPLVLGPRRDDDRHDAPPSPPATPPRPQGREAREGDRVRLHLSRLPLRRRLPEALHRRPRLGDAHRLAHLLSLSRLVVPRPCLARPHRCRRAISRDGDRRRGERRRRRQRRRRRERGDGRRLERRRPSTPSTDAAVGGQGGEPHRVGPLLLPRRLARLPPDRRRPAASAVVGGGPRTVETPTVALGGRFEETRRLVCGCGGVGASPGPDDRVGSDPDRILGSDTIRSDRPQHRRRSLRSRHAARRSFRLGLPPRETPLLAGATRRTR